MNGFLFILTILSLQSWATPKKSVAVTKTNLSTNISFDGQFVGGKFQKPLESTTVVENDKILDDLIGVRIDFKDRSLKAKGLR